MGEMDDAVASGSRYPVPVAIALGIVGMALLPVLFPVAMLQLAWEERRMQEAARRANCMVCGECLGVRALERAGALWGEHVAQLRLDHPHVKFRLVCPYDAVCVVCGAEYIWQDKLRAFQPVQAAASTT